VGSNSAAGIYVWVFVGLRRVGSGALEQIEGVRGDARWCDLAEEDTKSAWQGERIV
jgi:hypothetical protein